MFDECKALLIQEHWADLKTLFIEKVLGIIMIYDFHTIIEIEAKCDGLVGKLPNSENGIEEVRTRWYRIAYKIGQTGTTAELSPQLTWADNPTKLK